MEKLSTTIIKEGDQTWRYNPNPSVRGASLYSHGISWPPRSYSCSFCKREFRSAQALGGHMNVHRRDRARLRQYSPPSPWESSLINPSPLPNPNPNSSAKISIPNLNFEPPSPIKPDGAIKFSTFGYTTSLVAPIPFFEATKKMRDFMVEENNLLRENETRRFELEIDSDTDRLEDGLDLELRLGFA